MTSESLELYKIHAELADRVSQRRDSANRMFVSLLTGNLIFLAACLRFGDGDIISFDYILLVIGSFGLLLSVAWHFVIKSYKQLNSVKFEVLQDLEENLEFPFFRKEWDIVKKSKGNQRYTKITTAERILVAICGFAHLVMIFVGMMSLWQHIQITMTEIMERLVVCT